MAEFVPSVRHLRFLALVEAEPDGRYTPLPFFQKHWPIVSQRTRAFSHQKALIEHGCIEQLRYTEDGRPVWRNQITEKGRLLLAEYQFVLKGTTQAVDEERALLTRLVMTFIDEMCVNEGLYQITFKHFNQFFYEWLASAKDRLDIPAWYAQSSDRMMMQVLRVNLEAKGRIRIRRTAQGYVLTGLDYIGAEVTV